MRLQVKRNGVLLGTLDIAQTASARGPLKIPTENAPYEFILEGFENDRQYEISIGQVSIERQYVEEIGVDPREPGTQYRWRAYRWFDSCVGNVSLTVRSSDEDGGDRRDEGSAVVFVEPSKIQMKRYRAMIDNLRSVSGALVFDFEDLLRNKNSGLAWHPRGGQERLPNIERVQLGKIWTDLADSLAEIDQAPRLRLQRVRRISWCHGTDRMDAKAAALASAASTLEEIERSGVRTTVLRLEESKDTAEHRMMLGMLIRFGKKVARLRNAALADQRLCSVPLQAPLNPNSRDRERAREIERCERLRKAAAELERIQRDIHRALRLSVFQGVSVSHDVIRTPIFREIPAYRHFFRSMQDSLQVADWQLEPGPLEAVRRTDALYEMWVFIQLASAFLQAGLQPIDLSRLRHNPEPGRYILSLDRDTALLFRHENGVLIRLRYQPFIWPKKYALERGDSIFRTARYAFEPDAVIEFFRTKTERGVPRVPYVVVVDAKYSKQPDRCRASMTDYHKISATAGDGRHVAGQVWLAHVRDDEIRAEDEHWGGKAPSQSDPRNSAFDGELGLRPPEEVIGEMLPVPTAVRFVREVLDFIIDHPIMNE